MVSEPAGPEGGADRAPDLPADEPAWKLRAVERSTKAAKQRAERRLSRFLEAAQAIIAERGSIDFTVQEVVDRSHQSLRSFYQHFGGKHELLLALFEDRVRGSVEQIRAAAERHTDPLDQLRAAAEVLFEICRPGSVTLLPLFNDFARQLLTTRPGEVRTAFAPQLAVFAELMARVEEAGRLKPGVKPRRAAALMMETVMFTAQYNAPVDEGGPGISADEVWDFCAWGFVRDARD